MEPSFEVAGRVGQTQTELSAGLSELRGIRIAAGAVSLRDGRLCFRLGVSYAVAADLAASFPRPRWALVAVARARSGAPVATSLRDPTVNELEPPDPNFDERRTGRPSREYACGHLDAPMELNLGGERSALVHVALLDVLSNVIEVSAP
jgi:hypothetical protein